MKTIKDYMNKPYKMEIEPDIEEGGFVVSYPDLPGCITCADTIEQACVNAEDAKKCWFEAAFEEAKLLAKDPNVESFASVEELHASIGV